MRRRSTLRLWTAAGVGVALLAPVFSSHAATFTYTQLTTATDQWSTGAGWSGSTVPVSNAATVLIFGGTGAAGTFAAGAGPTIVTNNNLAGAAVNPDGRFELNQFTATYSSPAGTGNTAGSVTFSGGPLLFLNDGVTTPVLTLRSNSTSAGTSGNKPILTLSNDLFVGSTNFLIVGSSSFTGGPTGPAINLTGGLTFTTATPHTLELGGDHSTGLSTTAARNLITAAIIDHSAGNATTLIKSGTSFWDMTGANTYTGGTTINGGVLRATAANGMGSGAISVASGGQAWLEGSGTYNNNFSIAGSGPGGMGALRLAKDVILSNSSTITLTGDSRIGTNSLRTEFVTLDARITGTGNLTLGVGVANTPTITISNPLNDYVGNTTLLGESSTTTSGSSTSAQNVRLGASNVIPAGNLTLQMGTRASLTLELRGFNETVNGLNSAGQGLLTRAITNGNTTGTTASVLTVGDNNADGVYRGTITGSSTHTVAITKIGTGNQVLAGTSTYFGNTTINAGKLTLDYNQYAPTQTNSPGNAFSQNSTVVLNGGTLAIDGRGDGGPLTITGTTSGRLFTLGGASTTAGLVAGQFTGLKTAADVDIYIAGIDRIANTIYLHDTPAVAPTSITAVAMTAGTTSQTLKGLTIDAPAAVNSTIDFGVNGGVFLTFNAFAQTNNGSTLTIANWSGDLAGGGTDRLIFTGSSAAFGSLFSQSEILFSGYQPGYAMIEGTGNFEVVPVPEPTGIALLAMAGMGLLRRRAARR